MMRFILTVFLALLLFSNAGARSSENVRLAYVRDFATEDFQYLSEFFTGLEYTGNRLILRTDESSREGPYLVIELHSRATFTSGEPLSLSVFRNDQRDPATYTFTVPRDISTAEILIGITGEDTHEDLDILAWSYAIGGSTANPAASGHSFLWKMD